MGDVVFLRSFAASANPSVDDLTKQLPVLNVHCPKDTYPESYIELLYELALSFEGGGSISRESVPTFRRSAAGSHQREIIPTDLLKADTVKLR